MSKDEKNSTVGREVKLRGHMYMYMWYFEDHFLSKDIISWYPSSHKGFIYFITRRLHFTRSISQSSESSDIRPVKMHHNDPFGPITVHKNLSLHYKIKYSLFFSVSFICPLIIHNTKPHAWKKIKKQKKTGRDCQTISCYM